MKKLLKRTQSVHSRSGYDQKIKGVNTPIYTSTSYEYLDTDNRFYPRYFNTPNQRVVIDKICDLENGEDGIIFSSGMAAISTTIYSLLKRGDHIVFQPGLYGGTSHFINRELKKFGISFSIAESSGVEDLKRAIQTNTKIIYIETPSNPLLTITDISLTSAVAKSRNIISIIDNTFASPINQNPLDLGIDIVLHSATKYLGGHSDICAGVVISSKSCIKKIYKTAINLGGSLNATTCYLLERSIKTLALRVEQQNSNALNIARYLKKHPEINRVYYPGLKNHDGHEVARKQMVGFGGMVSFELKGIDSTVFQKRLNLIKPSMSLGGVESIICAPAITSHRHLSRGEREKTGIKDGLLRLSVGIEDVKDLINDLEQAF